MYIIMSVELHEEKEAFYVYKYVTSYISLTKQWDKFSTATRDVGPYMYIGREENSI